MWWKNRFLACRRATSGQLLETGASRNLTTPCIVMSPPQSAPFCRQRYEFGWLFGVTVLRSSPLILLTACTPGMESLDPPQHRVVRGNPSIGTVKIFVG